MSMFFKNINNPFSMSTRFILYNQENNVYLKIIYIVILIGIILLQICCGPGFYQGFAQGMTSASAGNNANKKLMLFGGENNNVYLGCLNCSEYSVESLFNDYGSYGSEYSSTSIWNQYGTYGSRYSQYSPWNTYALNPPVVVDENGNFYGYFTVNKYHAQRTTIPSLLKILNSNE